MLPELAAPPGCPVQFEMCHFRALQGLDLGSKWDSEQVKRLVITNYWNTSRYESPSNNFKLPCTNCDQCSIHFQNPLQTTSPGIFWDLEPSAWFEKNKTCLWNCQGLLQMGLWWDMFLNPNGNIWVGWEPWRCKSCNGRFLTSPRFPCLIG